MVGNPKVRMRANTGANKTHGGRSDIARKANWAACVNIAVLTTGRRDASDLMCTIMMVVIVSEFHGFGSETSPFMRD